MNQPATDLFSDESLKLAEDFHKQHQKTWDLLYHKGLKPNLIKSIQAFTAEWNRQARIEGMKQAQSRVLRRTEIPKDARNPTPDYVVILGEEIAGFIDQDIAKLQNQKAE